MKPGFVFPMVIMAASLVFFACSGEQQDSNFMYSCRLQDSSCIRVATASDCSTAGGVVVDACPASSSSSSSRPGSSSSVSSSSSVPVASNCSLNGGTVNIGGQVWMAKNLDCDVSGSVCYGNDPANCAKYGRLYNWSAAMSVCPSGWHLPSKAEWDALASYIESAKGCTSCDARHLKSASGWDSNGNGLDSYGFSALPGGYGSSGGYFHDVGIYGHWWSSSEIFSINAYYRLMSYGSEDADWYGSDKSFLFSVRCLQD